MGIQRIESVTTSFFGNGALEALPRELKKRQAKRALIITDRFLYESGMSGQVGDMLLKGGVEYATYYLVQPNPTVQVVNDCILAAKTLEVDWLVAVGGGSAIDTAKAASIVLTNGGNVEDYEGVGKSNYPGMPIVAVNTTAGTGSEVTTFYIVTDTKSHSKMCMVDENCKITIAVNDTKLMLGMPEGLTVSTGLDALTHAIEAVLSKRATPFTDKDALWAVKTIQEYLPKALRKECEEEARTMMSYAQYAAGMAFSNAGLGMVHAMAHALGGLYNLPHGLCNAVLLPYVMEFNRTYADVDEPYGKLAEAFDVEAKGQAGAECSKAVICAVQSLFTEVGMKKTLQDLNVQRADFEKLSQTALKDACMQDNPVFPSAEQVAAVYQSAYKGVSSF